jgi:hypothetical protein
MTVDEQLLMAFSKMAVMVPKEGAKKIYSEN